jgi:hypothetical protein
VVRVALDPRGLLLLVHRHGVGVNGTIDDNYNGLLGWFWIACAITTIGLSSPPGWP